MKNKGRGLRAEALNPSPSPLRFSLKAKAGPLVPPSPNLIGLGGGLGEGGDPYEKRPWPSPKKSYFSAKMAR
jgi:hypothetical protein